MTTTPTTIKTHETDELTETCGICQRQVSKYTCPSCNLFYCSLSCFRSEAHSRCSETFYRKEIETSIKTGPSKSVEERNKMLELLKRIESESAGDESEQSDEENESGNLALRLSAIDISSASSDDLLRILNEKEKEKFFASLKDPSSSLVQELLASTELERTRQLPWWEAPGDGSHSTRIPYGTKPDLMVVPANLICSAYHNTPLLYNISVVLLGYSYVTRHLSMSPLNSTLNDPQDQHEARKLLLRSIPFLGDRKSRVLHASLSDAVLSFWSQLDPASVDKKAMLALLKDVSKLVRPQRVITAVYLASEGKENGTCAADTFSITITALSDLSSLFSATDSSVINGGRNDITRKLTFYAAHVLSTPSSHLCALADEVLLLSNSMGRET